jgi:uncharacterized protein (TIGR03435 family)
LLSRFLRETVVDRTGLAGFYDVDLQWRPEDLSKPLAEVAPGVLIYSAIQAQLGLRLEARKGTLDVIVVDHARRMPIGN